MIHFFRINYAPAGLKRLFARANLTEATDADYTPQEFQFVPESDANLITSATGKGDWHLPVLDLDIPHTYVPSSTEGHGHLYLDTPVKWSDYEKLLRTLARLGILEHGYVEASIAKGATMVRKPGVKKAIDATGDKRPLFRFPFTGGYVDERRAF